MEPDDLDFLTFVRKRQPGTLILFYSEPGQFSTAFFPDNLPDVKKRLLEFCRGLAATGTNFWTMSACQYLAE